MTSVIQDARLHRTAQPFDRRQVAAAAQRSTDHDWPTARLAEFGRHDWTVARAETGASLDSLVGKGPCVVLSGVVCSHRTLAVGGRQILACYFRGEVLDPFTLCGAEGMGLTALSLCRIAVPGRAPDGAQDEESRQAAVWREAAREAAVSAEWLANIGRRPALSRMAHLLCEIAVRVNGPDFGDGSSCPFPMIQADLADALGLSVVHVNRTLQQLRRDRLVRLDRGRLTILHKAELVKLAGFSPGYLARPAQAA